MTQNNPLYIYLHPVTGETLMVNEDKRAEELENEGFRLRRTLDDPFKVDQAMKEVKQKWKEEEQERKQRAKEEEGLFDPNLQYDLISGESANHMPNEARQVINKNIERINSFEPSTPEELNEKIDSLRKWESLKGETARPGYRLEEQALGNIAGDVSERVKKRGISPNRRNIVKRLNLSDDFLEESDQVEQIRSRIISLRDQANDPEIDPNQRNQIENELNRLEKEKEVAEKLQKKKMLLAADKRLRQRNRAIFGKEDISGLEYRALKHINSGDRLDSVQAQEVADALRVDVDGDNLQNLSGDEVLDVVGIDKTAEEREIKPKFAEDVPTATQVSDDGSAPGDTTGTQGTSSQPETINTRQGALKRGTGTTDNEFSYNTEDNKISGSTTVVSNETYQAGDYETINEVASKTGVSTSKIRNLNPEQINNNGTIKSGSTLVLPETQNTQNMPKSNQNQDQDQDQEEDNTTFKLDNLDNIGKDKEVLIQFQNSKGEKTGTVWKVDPNSKRMVPFGNDITDTYEALNQHYPTMDSDELLKQVTKVDISEKGEGGQFGDYTKFPVGEGINTSGFNEAWEEDLNFDDNFYGKEPKEEIDKFGKQQVNQILEMSKKDEGIPEKQVQKYKEDEGLIKSYKNALMYGGYSLADIYRDIKKRSLIAQGEGEGLKDIKPISFSQPKGKYQKTKEYAKALQNSKLNLPSNLADVNNKLFELPIYNLPEKFWKGARDPVDVDSEEFQKKVDDLQWLVADAGLKKLEAKTDAQRAYAEYQKNEAIKKAEEDLEIDLSNQTMQAWSRLEQMKSKGRRNVVESGLLPAARQKYLQSVREQMEVLREDTKREKRLDKEKFLLKYATPEEIKNLPKDVLSNFSDKQISRILDKDISEVENKDIDDFSSSEIDKLREAKRRRLGLQPSDETKEWFSKDNLKKMFPDATDEEIENVRKTLFDKNGNFRSQVMANLYQKRLKKKQQTQRSKEQFLLQKELDKEQDQYENIINTLENVKSIRDRADEAAKRGIGPDGKELEKGSAEEIWNSGEEASENVTVVDDLVKMKKGGKNISVPNSEVTSLQQQGWSVQDTEDTTTDTEPTDETTTTPEEEEGREKNRGSVVFNAASGDIKRVTTDEADQLLQQDSNWTVKKYAGTEQEAKNVVQNLQDQQDQQDQQEGTGQTGLGELPVDFASPNVPPEVEQRVGQIFKQNDEISQADAENIAGWVEGATDPQRFVGLTGSEAERLITGEASERQGVTEPSDPAHDPTYEQDGTDTDDTTTRDEQDFDIPFTQNLDEDQKESIRNLVSSERKFSQADAQNFAFATGQSNFDKFTGMTGNEALDFLESPAEQEERSKNRTRDRGIGPSQARVGSIFPERASNAGQQQDENLASAGAVPTRGSSFNPAMPNISKPSQSTPHTPLPGGMDDNLFADNSSNDDEGGGTQMGGLNIPDHLAPQ